MKLRIETAAPGRNSLCVLFDEMDEANMLG